MDELTILAIEAARGILETEQTFPGTQSAELVRAAQEFLAHQNLAAFSQQAEYASKQTKFDPVASSQAG